MAGHYPNNRSSYKGKSKAKTAPEQAFMEGFLKMIVDLIKLLFGKKSNASSSVTSQLHQLSQSWEQVELYVLQPASYAVAISEADKILDAALRVKGLPGQTMGDRLKAAQPLFPPDLYNQIWSAHKLRNTLAHEVGASVDSSEVRSAVSSFRSALYQLGVLG